MFASSLLRSRLCLEEKQRPSSLSIVTCYVDFLKTEDFFLSFFKKKTSDSVGLFYISVHGGDATWRRLCVRPSKVQVRLHQLERFSVVGRSREYVGI
jgi:hypothetical protein